MAQFVPINNTTPPNSGPRFVPLEQKTAPTPSVDNNRDPASLSPEEVAALPTLRAGATQRQGIEAEPSFAGYLKGLGETAMTMGSGIVSEPLAGLSGLYELAYSYITDEEDPLGNAVKRVRQVQEDYTYQPRSEEGRGMLAHIAEPFEKISQTADNVGNKVLSATGSPALATIADIGIEALPGAVTGIRTGAGTHPSMGQRRREVGQVEHDARRLGINLKGSPEEVGDQTGRAARAMAGDRERGMGMEEVSTAVQAAREARRNHVNALYKDARSTKASIKRDDLSNFRSLVRDTFKEGEWDIDEYPRVEKRLSELDILLKNLPDNSSLKLNALEAWRKKISRNRAPENDVAQNTALTVLKGVYDSWRDGLFNADMIKGNPEAVTKWRKATAASSQFKKDFKEERVIKQLAEKEVTPEEMRSWIFNASEGGFKIQAGGVVKKLKEILGEDSPGFNALRQEASFTLLEPLLDRTPNINRFINNYDKMVRRNPMVAKELFSGPMRDLQVLRKFADASLRTFEKQAPWRIKSIIAQSMFGHDMSQSARNVSIVTKLFDRLQTAAGPGQKRKVLTEILGYDPGKSIFPKAPAPVMAAGETAERVSSDEERKVYRLPPINVTEEDTE